MGHLSPLFTKDGNKGDAIKKTTPETVVELTGNNQALFNNMPSILSRCFVHPGTNSALVKHPGSD